jgi:SH3-like domain-containing protein
LLGLSAASRVTWATDYKSIGPDPAILYDAPTTRGRKLFVAPRGMPVEVVVAQPDWIRVRDQSGDLSWVERKSLVDKRTVIATAGTAAHAGPDETTPVVFRVQQGVVLDLLEAPSNGYAHVRHRDGASGWLRLTDLWGT